MGREHTPRMPDEAAHKWGTQGVAIREMGWDTRPTRRCHVTCGETSVTRPETGVTCRGTRRPSTLWLPHSDKANPHMTAENLERLHFFFVLLSDRLQATFGVGIPDLPWRGWLLIAAGFWVLQTMMTLRTRQGSMGAWLIRLTFIAGTVGTALLGVSDGLRFTWQ